MPRRKTHKNVTFLSGCWPVAGVVRLCVSLPTATVPVSDRVRAPRPRGARSGSRGATHPRRPRDGVSDPAAHTSNHQEAPTSTSQYTAPPSTTRKHHQASRSTTKHRQAPRSTTKHHQAFVCSFVLLGGTWRCSGVLNGAWWCLTMLGGAVCLSRAAWRWLMVVGGSWWC